MGGHAQRRTPSTTRVDGADENRIGSRTRKTRRCNFATDALAARIGWTRGLLAMYAEEVRARGSGFGAGSWEAVAMYVDQDPCPKNDHGIFPLCDESHLFWWCP